MTMIWSGKLDLVYAQRQSATKLIHNYNQAPLKIQRPFYPEGQQVCHSVILHTAGGVVGGDRLQQNFHLQPQSQALITTSAASKIYYSNGLEARQNIEINIENDACLEWFPQETIVFDGAIYRQDIKVNLGTGASWLCWEITRFGRSARGEKFIQGNWRSHTEVYQAGKPLWIDRQWLPGREDVFSSPHGLAEKPVVGTFVFFGHQSPELVQQARLLVGNFLGGVTALECGFLCRYRGYDTAEVRNWFVDIWKLLRMSFWGRDICLPRVWVI